MLIAFNSQIGPLYYYHVINCKLEIIIMWIKSIHFKTTHKFGIFYTPIDLKDKYINGPTNVNVPHLHGWETTIFWCKILHKWKKKLKNEDPITCPFLWGVGELPHFLKRMIWLHFQFNFCLVFYFVFIFEMFR